MKYLPVKLNKWKHPSNYYGEVWPEYYVFLSQTRDSDALTRSNYICGLEQIGGRSETVVETHERHWACGWLETILIHEDDYEALRKADAITKKLEDYPVIDEDHFSELEYLENDEEDFLY